MLFRTYADDIKHLPKFTDQKILFIFAHPDDEQYMAGTIQRFLSLGHTVYIAFTTSGKFGTDVTGTYTSGTDALRDARELEAVNSLTNLGVPLLNIIPLRQDDNGTNVRLIYDELLSKLSGAGYSGINCVISFDHNGVYTTGAAVEHSVTQQVALEYFKQTESVTNAFYFTIPESDINPITSGDLTSGNFVIDGYVDCIVQITSAEIVKKQDVIDFHVTQYADPNKTLIKDHYAARPWEYFSFGYEKIDPNVFPNREYLRMLFNN